MNVDKINLCANDVKTWELRGRGSLTQNLIKRLISLCFFCNVISPKPLTKVHDLLYSILIQYLPCCFDMHVVGKLLKIHFLWWWFCPFPSWYVDKTSTYREIGRCSILFLLVCYPFDGQPIRVCSCKRHETTSHIGEAQ